ncbi:glycoside hydrolase domain-containing protein [Paenibacillus prosopidis]|nr:glycoside hydrolase domain-containing protein [Paenibacillus prosopidis]
MRKKWLSLFLVVNIFMTIVPIVHAEGGKIDLWVENALKNVYRNSTIPELPDTSINIVSAKNEYESAQIALRSDTEFEITVVEFTDLTAADNKIIEGNNLSYHFEEYELTDTVKQNPFFPDREGNLIYPQSELPDPLSNESSIQVAANSTQPIFITNYVPASAGPGDYEGTITVKTTLGDYAVPIRVEVADVEIPKTSEANFVNYQWTMTNGFTWDGFSWDGTETPLYDAGENYYGVETYSDEWFDLVDRFAKVMTDYRQNMIWVRTDLLLQAKGTYLSAFTDGIPENIDWSLFDRYVQTFIDRGVTDFANNHLIHPLNKMPANEKPDASWNTNLPDALPETDKFLKNYLTALHDHLEEKGWLNEDGITWYQHIRDEPSGDDARNYWTYVARKVKEIIPDFKTMDADPDGILMNDTTKPYVDVWVPLTPAFQAKKDLYKAEQTAGKDMWVYTCEVNQPPWLNRLWTQPTLTGRLLFWNLSQDGVTGHLHWAWNAWYVGSWYGDSTIVYPDKDHMTVKSSLRYEAQRDGIEEYELMYKIKQTNPELAKRIADSAVNPEDPRKYTLDPDYIKLLHDYMVKAAAGEDAGGIPASTSPYDGQATTLTYMTDNTSSDISFSGSWFEKSRQFAYLGSVKSTTAAGSSLEYEFTGTGIDVIVEKNDGAGRLSISIDGSEPVIVDAYEKVPHDYFTIYNNRNLSIGKHTVKIVNLDGKTLSFDGFRVQMYEGQQLYDASLKSLELTNAPLFNFRGSITNYQIMLPEDAGAISITPTLMDEAGSITINGKSIENGMVAAAEIPVGKSRITIRSTASDGKTAKVYTLNFLKGNKNEVGANVARDYSEITASAARSGDQGVTYGPQKMADGSYGTMYASLQGYNDTHPFPHEIVMTWNEPQAFNTIVMATPSGLIQGITDIDVQVSTDGTSWETVAQRVPLTWKSNKDDGVMEHTYANIPAVSGVLKMRVQINDAYYISWNMYAVYELELYSLPDNGEIDVQVTRDVALSALELKALNSGQPIDLSFDPSVKEYAVRLGLETEQIAITPTLKNNYGTLEIGGVPMTPGQTAIATIPEGLNTLTVKAIGDQGAVKEYNIAIKRIDNLAAKASSISLDKPMEGSTDAAYLNDEDYTTVFTNGSFNTVDEFQFPHTIDLKWDSPQSFNTFALIVPDGAVDHKPSTIALKVKKEGQEDWTQILHDNYTWTENGDTVYWPLYEGLNPDKEGGYYYERLPILAQEGITEMQIVIYAGRFYSTPYYYEINDVEIANIATGGQIEIEVTDNGGNEDDINVIAAGITSIAAPAKDAKKLTLPTVPDGYTIAIKSSSNTRVIKTNGKINPPKIETTVTLVLEVTRTSDGAQASTGEISVVVPSKK